MPISRKAVRSKNAGCPAGDRMRLRPKSAVRPPHAIVPAPSTYGQPTWPPGARLQPGCVRPALPRVSRTAPPGLPRPTGDCKHGPGASDRNHAPLSRQRRRRLQRRRQPCQAPCRGCCASATMAPWTRASSACLCSSSARPRRTSRATEAARLCWPSRARCAVATCDASS